MCRRPMQAVLPVHGRSMQAVLPVQDRSLYEITFDSHSKCKIEYGNEINSNEI